MVSLLCSDCLLKKSPDPVRKGVKKVHSDEDPENGDDRREEICREDGVCRDAGGAAVEFCEHDDEHRGRHRGLDDEDLLHERISWNAERRKDHEARKQKRPKKERPAHDGVCAEFLVVHVPLGNLVVDRRADDDQRKRDLRQPDIFDRFGDTLRNISIFAHSQAAEIQNCCENDREERRTEDFLPPAFLKTAGQTRNDADPDGKFDAEDKNEECGRVLRIVRIKKLNDRDRYIAVIVQRGGAQKRSAFRIIPQTRQPAWETYEKTHDAHRCQYRPETEKRSHAVRGQILFQRRRHDLTKNEARIKYI